MAFQNDFWTRMKVELVTILSALRITRNGPVSQEELIEASRLPKRSVEKVLVQLCNDDFLQASQGDIRASPKQRVRLAVHAVRVGGDLHQVCRALSWTEFEAVAAQAFEANGYETIQNFRFKDAAKRWEIDVLGLKKPLIICVDCKHWKRGLRKAATMKAVVRQTQRAEALSNALPNYVGKARLDEWNTATLIPVVLSLETGFSKFCDDVPLVPVLQFQDFIRELPAHAENLKHFHQKRLRADTNLSDFC